MIDLEYTEIDGLLYPNIQFDDAEGYDDLGKYGRHRLNYLHKQKPQQYRELLFTGKLAQHCAEVEKSAFEMAERVREQHLKKHPAPNKGMERIQAFEQAQMLADEQALHDIVCFVWIISILSQPCSKIASHSKLFVLFSIHLKVF